MATMAIPVGPQRQTDLSPGAKLHRTFVDLGLSPPCETYYPSAADLSRGEVYYPLHVYVCEQCFLVQLDQSNLIWI